MSSGARPEPGWGRDPAPMPAAPLGWEGAKGSMRSQT